MEYGIIWLDKASFIMPRDADVVKEGIKKYLLATSRQHDTIMPNMYGALDDIFEKLDKEEADDFRKRVSSMVQEIINDKNISYDFYKSDNVAWSEYILGRGSDDNKQKIREILDDYAKETTLYEVYTGSNDYQRMKGFSMFKFGRDMENLPVFEKDILKDGLAGEKIKVAFDSPPVVLNIDIKKDTEGTAKNLSFASEYRRFKKAQKRRIKTLQERYSKATIDELLEKYNEIITEDGFIAQKRSNMKKQDLIDFIISNETNLSKEPVSSQKLGNALRIKFKMDVDEKTVDGDREDSVLYFALQGKTQRGTRSMVEVASLLLDEKRKAIADRGVLSGSWLTKNDLKFSKISEKEILLPNASELFYAVSQKTNIKGVKGGVRKLISKFTLEDLVGENFLEGKETEYNSSLVVRTDNLMKELISEGDIGELLSEGLKVSNTVVVNKVVVKFLLPSLGDIRQDLKTIRGEALFDKRMRELDEQIKNLKASVSLLVAEYAEYDTNPYSSEGQNISENMANHIDLMKERLEELEDFGIEIKGFENDMKEEN